MSAAKRDLSGIFRQANGTGKSPHRRPKPALVSANGVTFSSNSYLAPFTEVRVKMQPRKGASLRQPVNCSGVVVDCHNNRVRTGYTVSVAFLDVPKQVENRLRQSSGSLASEVVLSPATKISRPAAFK